MNPTEEPVSAESPASGDRIKKVRDATGLSQRQFGARIPVKQQTVARWEKGAPIGDLYVSRVERAIADLETNGPSPDEVAGKVRGPADDAYEQLRLGFVRGVVASMNQGIPVPPAVVTEVARELGFEIRVGDDWQT